MTIEELFNFIRAELKGYAFIDKTLEDMRPTMESRPHFQPEKFKKWFVDKEVIYKNSPLAFLIKCGLADVEKGLFDREEIKAFDMRELAEEMERKGLPFKDKDLMRLERYMLYIYEHDLLTLAEIQAWVSKMLNYMQNNGENGGFFKIALHKSPLMKALHLPYGALEESLEKDYAEITNLIEEIEEMKEEVVGEESETKNED